MSRETSAGVATVTQLCEAFGISRAAYYAAKKPRPAAKVVAIRLAPAHTSSEVVLAAIREVIAVERAWGVRKVWATLARQGSRSPERGSTRSCGPTDSSWLATVSRAIRVEGTWRCPSRTVASVAT